MRNPNNVATLHKTFQSINTIIQNTINIAASQLIDKFLQIAILLVEYVEFKQLFSGTKF